MTEGHQLDVVERAVVEFVETDAVVGVVAVRCRDGEEPQYWTAGRRSPDGEAVLRDDRFLIASLTKPIVATAALQLVARGKLALGDRLHDLIDDVPARLRPVTVRHLLTHTGGFADVWPDNVVLRTAHASLPEFVAASLRAELLHRPGTAAVYSSIGYSLLGAILETVSGRPLRTLLNESIFTPLGMTHTSLGLNSDDAGEDVVPIRLPAEVEVTDWHWNSRYWKTLGAPWGGLISSADDVMRFLTAFTAGDDGALIPSVLRDAAWRNHVPELIGPTDTAHRRGWGLGWRRNWPVHAAALCEVLPDNVVGHYGATGTLMWVDPNTGQRVVILSNEPALGRPAILQRLANVLACSH